MIWVTYIYFFKKAAPIIAAFSFNLLITLGVLLFAIFNISFLNKLYELLIEPPSIKISGSITRLIILINHPSFLPYSFQESIAFLFPFCARYVFHFPS